MNTLEAFIFSNECVAAQAIANVWNRLHGTSLTAAQVSEIAAELNRRLYSFSF
jgi:hemolysin activation/secretion protein